nr:uncharacterized protein LOC100382111 [Ipomoea batatas]
MDEEVEFVGTVSDLPIHQAFSRIPRGRDDGRDYNVPPDDETGADDLFQELDAAGAAVNATPGVGDRQEEVAKDGLGEDAGENAAEEAGYGVDQAGDHSLDGANNGGFLKVDNVKTSPNKETSGGANVGVEDGEGGIDVSAIRIAAVEAGPPHPQQPCPGQHQQHIIWWKSLPWKRKPPPHRLNAPTVYENVSHSGTNIIHALMFIRPSTDPARITTVMAANTHWNHTIDAMGLPDEELLGESRARLGPEGEDFVAEGHLVRPGDPADDDGGESVERHESGVNGPFLLDDAAVEDDEARHAL